MDTSKKIILSLGDRLVGDGQPTYIIAEIGLAHQGSVDIAKQLVDAAVAAGADCAKFQKRSISQLFKQDVLDAPHKEERGFQYLFEHIQKNELSEDDMRTIRDYCRQKGIDFACTPWDEESLRFLETLDPPFYKIGSPDMFNFPLIKQVATLKRPMFISTGMSYVSEIEELVQFLDEIGADYLLLHCNSTYPAPYQDINLAFLPKLKEISHGRPVGYSGHDQGIAVSVAAVAMGAKVIEKHITLSRDMPGPDHKASLEPHEFTELVTAIRAVEESIGEPVRFLSRGEYMNRQHLSKSLVANRLIKRGEILTEADIGLKSPGKGTSPMKLSHFVGKQVVQRDIPKDEYLLDSDIGEDIKNIPIEKITLNHKWGVVARMSDIEEVLPCGSDFVEIHLSDSDVREDRLGDREFYDRDVTIHAPEYDGENLVDLSSLDPAVRKRSIEAFNRVLDHGRRLKKKFKNGNERVKVVIHGGGMDMHAPLLDHIPELNANLADSLGKLNSDGFELLVENMPGSPWYFGGTWHHSNFMDAKEIAEFSKKTGYGIVFDTSHAALYCNRYKVDFEEYVKAILPVTKFLHISDGARDNGEGLGIGDGTIDFKMLLSYIAPRTDLWILPEIWQGHKFGGNGFRLAIKKLKAIDPRL